MATARRRCSSIGVCFLLVFARAAAAQSVSLSFSPECEAEIAGLCASDDAFTASSVSCLASRYRELSDECFSEFTRLVPAAAGPCTADARALCVEEFASSTATTTQCLVSHHDELSDACRTKVDNEQDRRDSIPDNFIESRYYLLTKVRNDRHTRSPRLQRTL